ncbi:glycosyltransferase family 1 protein [Clostridium perfringens]|nr:glycosyltransferase family 1 protein [Clostridium perfringens]
MDNIVIFNALQTSLSGGIGRYCEELARNIYLNREDLDIKIVIREEDKERYNFVEKNSLIVVRGIKNGFHRNIYEQFKLPKFVYKKYPNAIIHYPDTMAPLLSKNKVITTMHDMAFRTLKDEFSLKTKIWKNFITKKSVKKVNKIIAITNFTKGEIIKYYPGVENKISVIYNGFNDFSNEEINMENVSEKIASIKERFILSVNTITPRKNIGGIIEAFNMIKDKTDANLVIAGKKGWKSEEILSLINKYNINNRVHVVGKINDDELKYLYKNASVYVYVSFYEGFGLSPLEAMSFQVPTIVSNVTSIPEVVGNMAVKVNPSDIKILSYEIYKLLEDEHYILNSKENIIKEKKVFSWKKCSKQTINLYKELFANNNR